MDGSWKSRGGVGPRKWSGVEVEGSVLGNWPTLFSAGPHRFLIRNFYLALEIVIYNTCLGLGFMPASPSGAKGLSAIDLAAADL